LSDDRERDLAEAIYAEIISPELVDDALEIWNESALRGWDRMRTLLDVVANAAMDRVLARRQREAARTGPWDADLVDRIKRGERADPVTELMAQVYATDWDTADDDQRIWWRLKSLQVREALAARTEPKRGAP